MQEIFKREYLLLPACIASFLATVVTCYEKLNGILAVIAQSLEYFIFSSSAIFMP